MDHTECMAVLRGAVDKQDMDKQRDFFILLDACTAGDVNTVKTIISSENRMGGYTSSSYSYQSTGKPVKPNSQYEQSNSAGYANSHSYERSNSNIDQNSGASLGPAGYPVSKNSNSSAGTNSYTA